jgi:hypothetical protein
MGLAGKEMPNEILNINDSQLSLILADINRADMTIFADSGLYFLNCFEQKIFNFSS